MGIKTADPLPDISEAPSGACDREIRKPREGGQGVVAIDASRVAQDLGPAWHHLVKP